VANRRILSGHDGIDSHWSSGRRESAVQRPSVGTVTGPQSERSQRERYRRYDRRYRQHIFTWCIGTQEHDSSTDGRPNRRYRSAPDCFYDAFGPEHTREPDYDCSSAHRSSGGIVMNGERGGLLERLFAAERQFYDRVPVKNVYSKLVFRTVVWFLLFWTV
jgi:hypothetical protein